MVKNSVIVLTLFLVTSCTSFVDSALNRVVTPPPYQPGSEAEQLHSSLIVADLHADSLLWNRDLLEDNSRGHIDIPRLQEGNVGLQVFTAVTKVPWWVSFEENPSDSDMITMLTRVQGWPKRTRKSLLERALYQGEKIHYFINRSGGNLILITNRKNLHDIVTARRGGESVIGAVLGIEGAHALEGDILNLDRLYNQGFRLIGLTHFFDNDVAGSAHGKNKGGLTELGRELVKRVEQRCMILDLVHASPQAINETLLLVSRPVIVSHTGVQGKCNNVRNLSDRHIRAVAGTGGLIGLALFEPAMCENSVEETAGAMRYVADLVGVKHVALGSDFDGASTTSIDASGLVLLTEALMHEGFSKEDISSIMGENVIRLLDQVLCDE